MARDDASIRIMRKLVVDVFLIAGLVLCVLLGKEYYTPFERGFFCGDESLMFPYRDDTVTVSVLRAVGLLLPAFAFLICEWTLLRKESSSAHCFSVRIPAWLRGFYCTLASFCLGYSFVEFSTDLAKYTIGRPRPHFFDVCRPSVDCSSPTWQRRYIQSHEYTCTGPMTEKFKDMRMSFLSGHSALAAYSMVYLALYLQSRMSWRGTRVLRHTLQFLALMMSWFTALSRVSDYKHHWSDVLAGYSLGTTLAVAVWLWCTDTVKARKKHTLLPQTDVAFEHRQVAVPL